MARVSKFDKAEGSRADDVCCGCAGVVWHWTIAAAVLLNGLVTEGGDTVHISIGYVMVAMLVLRLLWGVVGTEEARFSAFRPSLAAARAHIGDMFARRTRWHRSHNPLGTLMVYAFWATLTVVAATGITMAGSPFDTGPQSAAQSASAEHAAPAAGETDDGEADDGDEEDEVLVEIHEIAANLLLILAALHVGGVALESWLSGRNLAREMVMGRRSRGTA